MSDPYASHLPILKFVLALVKPKWVLELGAGVYSTEAFKACPSVQRLVTIETDERWVPSPAERMTIRLVDDVVEELPNDLMDYDLIFIDNGQNAEERIAAIRAVLSRPHPVTVIHDAEVYGGVIHELAENRITFDYDTPWTAVCW